MIGEVQNQQTLIIAGAANCKLEADVVVVDSGLFIGDLLPSK